MADDPFVRPCDGTCGDESPHTHHLTEAGRERYSTVPIPKDLVGDARKNIFFDATTPREVLGELAGYTSMCWTNKIVEEGKYGRPDKKERVFDSERASKAVDQALDRLEELGFITPSIKEN